MASVLASPLLLALLRHCEIGADAFVSDLHRQSHGTARWASWRSAIEPLRAFHVIAHPTNVGIAAEAALKEDVSLDEIAEIGRAHLPLVPASTAAGLVERLLGSVVESPLTGIYPRKIGSVVAAAGGRGTILVYEARWCALAY